MNRGRAFTVAGNHLGLVSPKKEHPAKMFLPALDKIELTGCLQIIRMMQKIVVVVKIEVKSICNQ